MFKRHYQDPTTGRTSQNWGFVFGGLFLDWRVRGGGGGATPSSVARRCRICAISGSKLMCKHNARRTTTSHPITSRSTRTHESHCMRASMHVFRPHSLDALHSKAFGCVGITTLHLQFT